MPFALRHLRKVDARFWLTGSIGFVPVKHAWIAAAEPNETGRTYLRPITGTGMPTNEALSARPLRGAPRGAVVCFEIPSFVMTAGEATRDLFHFVNLSL